MIVDLEEYRFKLTIPELESKFDGWKSIELAEHMYEIKAIKEDMETALKYINGEYDHIRKHKLPEQMEEEGIEALTLLNIGRVNLSGDMYVTCAKTNKKKLFQWLRDVGKGDLIQEDVNPSTLKAAIKEMMKKGDKIPDGILKVAPFTKASITKV